MVHIKQTKQFNLVIQYGGLVVSFRLVSTQVLAAQEQLNLGYLNGSIEVNMSSSIRGALAENL